MVASWTQEAQVGLVAAQLLVLVVAALVATRQVREARRLREQQYRPFVVIDFEVDDPWISLVITNLGTSLARDIRFEVQPELRSSLEDQPALGILNDGIPTLAPGKVLRTFFDGFIQRKDSGLPDRYEATVSYRDESGRRQFSEALSLDLAIYKSFTYLVRHDIHDIHKVLKEMQKEMKKWTAGSRGVLAMSPEQRRDEQERARQAREEFHRLQEQSEAEGQDGPH